MRPPRTVHAPVTRRAAPALRFPVAALASLAAAAGALVATRLVANPYTNPDSRAFEALARALLAGHGLVYREPLMPGLDLVAFRSPVYAAFVALGLRLGGVAGVLALQGALTGIGAALVGAIGARLAGRGAGWLAFAFAALWPSTWVMAGQLMSELFYTVLVIATTWLALEGVARGTRWRIVLAGVLGALAMLTRPPGAGLCLAVAGWLAWRAPRAALAFTLAALVTWAPWPVRNAARLHAFVPTLTSGGLNAWTGSTGIVVSRGWDMMHDRERLGELGLDRYFWRLALAHARAAPGDVAARIGSHALCYAIPREHDLGARFHLLVLALGGVALLLAGVRSVLARLTLPLAVWLGHFMVTVPIVTYSRYRLPTEWVVAVAAAAAISAALARARGRGTGASAATPAT